MACRSISLLRRVKRKTIGCVRFSSAHCCHKRCCSRIVESLSLAVSGYGCGRHFDAFTMPLGPAAVLAPRDPWRAMHAMEASAL
jgi:hypothetical protein